MDLPLRLGDEGDDPLFLRIARAIADDVRRGRLAPGARLPGSRSLAETLSVHRNTVLAAFDELLAEGWLEARAGKGTFVSSALPDVVPRRFGKRAPARRDLGRVGFDLPVPAVSVPKLPAYPRGMLRMFGGLPDLRLVPVESLSRAYRRTLRGGSGVLDYGDPRGHERLRDALAKLLAMRRGLAIGADDVLVTRGSQMALSLMAATIVRPGDVVAVEAFGYRPAWDALRRAGARLVPVRVDEHGLDVDALAKLCDTERVRAVYVTPHHQYPTTVALSPGRRLALLSLARRNRLAVLEDDYDHEFHYEGRPLLPLASEDDEGVVLYFGTLSKVLAPGLRIGYAIAPRAVLDAMTAHRFGLDRQGDQAVECAVAELVEDGEHERHTRRMRREYRARRDLCADLLERHLAGVLRFRVPNGGMALWAKVDRSLDVEKWRERAESLGVTFQVGRQFSFAERPEPYVRLGYAALDAKELHEAVRRLVRALPRAAR